MDAKNIANKIIDALGGTSVVAGICSVSTGAVSQWRDYGIPKAQWKYLVLLRPDVFDDQEWPPTDYSEKEAA